MTVYALIFYVVAGFILAATGLAITRRHPVHAVAYLILSFLGSALLFYLLGGALFGRPGDHHLRRRDHGPVPLCDYDAEGGGGRGSRDDWAQWAPAIVLGLVFLSVAGASGLYGPAQPGPP